MTSPLPELCFPVENWPNMESQKVESWCFIVIGVQRVWVNLVLLGFQR